MFWDTLDIWVGSKSGLFFDHCYITFHKHFWFFCSSSFWFLVCCLSPLGTEMSEADGGGRRVESSGEMVTTTNAISLFPRDLLQSFMPASAEQPEYEEEGEEEEEEDVELDKIELNLGLSLGGRFGIDKTSSGIGPKKLTRSSSIVGTMPIFRQEIPADTAAEAEARPTTAVRNTGLTRSTSLPVETEEEWRKRKEMQTLRRMAAKRRRSEKLRNSRNLEDSGSGRGGATAAGLPRWSAAANKGGFLRQYAGDSRQGSAESHGGGGGGSSSSLSEFESKPPKASSNCSEEAKSLTSTQPTQQEPTRGTTTATTTTTTSNRLRRLSSVDMNTQGKGKNEMPCVFTKGDGPNGRRVDGILYRYGKGAEVRIMCVCHGTFLSPAEFVKHAGGGDVDHPLRHIVVNTASASSSSTSSVM